MTFELNWITTCFITAITWAIIGSAKGIFEINQVKKWNLSFRNNKVNKFSLIIYYLYNVLFWPLELVLDCLSSKDERNMGYFADKNTRYNVVFFVLMGLSLVVSGIFGINSCIIQNDKNDNAIILNLNEWSNFYIAIKSTSYKDDRAKIIDTYNFKDFRDLESNELDFILKACFYEDIKIKFMCNYGVSRTKERTK